jgi:GNAT superfamily N-acetyltransferase
MGGGLDQAELRRRAVHGVAEEVAVFGAGAPDSRVIRRDGLIASVVPATPQRSIFNSVFHTDTGVLAAELDRIAAVYDDAGVRAWTVWVTDGDRAGAELLEGRGHALDTSPRVMALELANLASEPPQPDGIELRAGDAAVAAALNDRAYGYGPDGFRAALAVDAGIVWHFAAEGEETIGCVGSIPVGDDCVITGVATPPEYRRRGIAGWLLWKALDRARAEGFMTGSLQASKAGAAVYERLGFSDFGFFELWERRR